MMSRRHVAATTIASMPVAASCFEAAAKATGELTLDAAFSAEIYAARLQRWPPPHAIFRPMPRHYAAPITIFSAMPMPGMLRTPRSVADAAALFTVALLMIGG